MTKPARIRDEQVRDIGTIGRSTDPLGGSLV